jgi:hypothetical protein
VIIEWTEEEIKGLAGFGLTRIVTEVGEHGRGTRELGHDDAGHLVHRFPGEGQ